MGEKILKNIRLIRESRPYTDCLYSVLTASNMFHEPKYMLSGMTGMAFIFIAHKNLIISSTEMYGMRFNHWRALNILGIYSEIIEGRRFQPTFPLYRDKAVQKIKESIVNEKAAIVFAPRITDFGVIYGFDDEDEVLFYKDIINKEEQIILYKNLFKHQSEYWMCQSIGNRIDRDIKDIYLDSMEIAIDQWDMEIIMERTRGEYASGKKAYDNLIKAFEINNFHEIGASRILNYKVLAMEEIKLFMENVAREIPELSDAAQIYSTLNDVYREITNIVPNHYYSYYMDDNPRIHRKDIPTLIKYLKIAKDTEEQAIREIKKYMKEVVNNREIDFYNVKQFY